MGVFVISEQARLDGAFCHYTEAEKLKYLNHLQEHGVKNMEMEAIPFAALTHHAGIKSAIVCVALLDRLKGDQVRNQDPRKFITYKSCRKEKKIRQFKTSLLDIDITNKVTYT